MKKEPEGVKEHFLNIEEQNRENAETEDHYNRVMYVAGEKLPRVHRYIFQLPYIDRLKNEQIGLSTASQKEQWRLTRLMPIGF